MDIYVKKGWSYIALVERAMDFSPFNDGIGDAPYILLERIDELARLLLKNYFSIFNRLICICFQKNSNITMPKLILLSFVYKKQTFQLFVWSLESWSFSGDYGDFPALETVGLNVSRSP